MLLKFGQFGLRATRSIGCQPVHRNGLLCLSMDFSTRFTPLGTWRKITQECPGVETQWKYCLCYRDTG